MFEALLALPYHRGMTVSHRSGFARRIISFMNLTEQPQPLAIRSGDSVAAAWAATGGYLRRAMSSHETAHPKPARAKR